MPRLIIIEGHAGQRRQLAERIKKCEADGYALMGKFEAGVHFADWRALFENAEGRGLFADKQLIVCESCELLGEFPDKFLDLIEPEGTNVQSVIIAAFSADVKELKKYFSPELLKSKKILFLKGEAEVPPWKRKEWLLNIANERKIKLEPDAAALLGEFIESQEELRSVLDNLGAYAAKKNIKIDVNLVRALSFDEGSRAQLTFLDGVCQGRYKDVSQALKYLKRDSFLPVLTGLCNRLRPAVYISAFPKNVEDALKAIGVNIGSKNYSVKMAKNALTLYGAGAVAKFIIQAAKLSYIEKTQDAEGWEGFELILWELMASKKLKF